MQGFLESLFKRILFQIGMFLQIKKILYLLCPNFLLQSLQENWEYLLVGLDLLLLALVIAQQLQEKFVGQLLPILQLNVEVTMKIDVC